MKEGETDRQSERERDSILSPFLIGRMFLGEASWFLIGPTFLRKPSWKYSSKLYSGSKKLRSTCSGNTPYWTIVASDWLRAELSCG